MDATRTQMDAAVQRFAYRRGFNDALMEMQRDAVVDSILTLAMVLIAVAIGWLLAKRLG